MGKEYEVKVTPYALRQMQEIVNYISVTLQSSDNAVNWLDMVKKEKRDGFAVLYACPDSSDRRRTLA